MVPSLSLALVLVATSVLSALTAMLVMQLRRPRPGPEAARPYAPDIAGRAVLIYDDRRLVDANAHGQTLLQSARAAADASGAPESADDDLEPVLRLLALRFPDLRDRLPSLVRAGRITLGAADDSGFEMVAEWRGGLAHLTVIDTRADGSCLLVDRLSFDALQGELEGLRECMSHAPVAIWRTDADGAVIWANRAYLDLAARGPGLSGWPLPRLFPALDQDGPQRLKLELGSSACWFECRGLARAQGTLNYAIPADSAARSEKARHDLVQTLAGAFAMHPVGLAVFDDARVLQIFNPALMDMTGLSAEFLASRPGFDRFLHALRERRMLPEPADYRSWRSALLELERAAQSGAYQEEWPLPSGQTLHVTGRPHPEGGIAFLFEDVTSEMTLTRSFRAQIETAQTVIDALPDALAVFSAQGTFRLANAAYHRLWGTDPMAAAGHGTMQAALDVWRTASHPSPLWPKLAEGAVACNLPQEVTGTAALRNGIVLAVRLQTLVGGNLLVSFSRARPDMAETADPSAPTVSRPPVAAAVPGVAQGSRPSITPEHAAHQAILSRGDPLADAGSGADRAATPTVALAASGNGAAPAASDAGTQDGPAPRAARVRHRSSRSVLRG